MKLLVNFGQRILMDIRAIRNEDLPDEVRHQIIASVALRILGAISLASGLALAIYPFCLFVSTVVKMTGWFMLATLVAVIGFDILTVGNSLSKNKRGLERQDGDYLYGTILFARIRNLFFCSPQSVGY